MHRNYWILAAGLVVFVAGCRPAFQPSRFSDSEALYEASLRQFNRGKWDDAIAGFDKLTLDLAVRDSLLPRSYWYLARAYQRSGEHILSAQAFDRLSQSFPEDSLAPAAGLEAARMYLKMWPKVDRDPTYGETALETYATVAQFFPGSPQADTAEMEFAALQDRFAMRDYTIGLYYLRDNAHDSALIYFRDVLDKYPDTPTARLAGLRMVEAFRAIRYNDDAADMCVTLTVRYPGDAEVSRACRVGTEPAPVTRTSRAPAGQETR